MIYEKLKESKYSAVRTMHGIRGRQDGRNEGMKPAAFSPIDSSCDHVFIRVSAATRNSNMRGRERIRLCARIRTARFYRDIATMKL